MKEFIDRERSTSKEIEKITALMDEGRVEEAKDRLQELIRRDPYFLKSYVILSEIYELEGKVDRARDTLEEAYRRALELISEGGKLPERLEWRHPINRHIIEALISFGVLLWELGEVDRALQVLKEVYSMNPADEPGVRFYILAILEGMGFEDFEQTFSRDGEYDYEDLKRWFTKHSKEHRFFQGLPME